MLVIIENDEGNGEKYNAEGTEILLHGNLFLVYKAD